MTRRLRVLAVALLLIAPLFATQQSAAAAGKSYPLNPSHNITAPSYVFQGACASAPRSTGCTALFVRALNYARGQLGQPRYSLPLRFVTLSGPERLLVLSNQDRVLYGRVSLSGLNTQLDRSAHHGVFLNGDPAFVPVHGNQPLGGGSNWAGGGGVMVNPLYAYFLWMYDDGPGSGNADCQHAGDPGCWGHRDNTLGAFGPNYKVLMGVGGGASKFGYSWTEIYEAFRQSDVTPLIPTVQGISTHVGHAGTVVHIAGFGLSHTDRVAVVGHTAKVRSRDTYRVDITVPAGSGSGWVVVATNGGISSKNYAAAFAYS